MISSENSSLVVRMRLSDTKDKWRAEADITIGRYIKQQIVGIEWQEISMKQDQMQPKGQRTTSEVTYS